MARELQSLAPVSAPLKGRRIVLVDDEEALAWSLSSRLMKVLQTDRIETANDGETVLASILAEKSDLLIADIRMPGMSGIDLVLSARRVYPDLPVIVMTAFKSADITRLDSGPFTGFLEKPFEFDALLRLVEQAFTPQVVGFSGAISVQTLPDVVQLYVLSSATGKLTVRHGPDQGEIYFAQGAITDAVTSNHRGDDAFYEIMMWSGGEFSMQPGATAQQRSVHSNWQELLMESVRRMDETRRAGAPHSQKTGWTQAPPPIDADSFEDAFSDFSLPDAAQLAPAPVPTISVPTPQKMETSMNIKDSLSKLNQIDGFIGAALVDAESGMLLGQEGGGNINLEIAAAGNTEVVRAKRKTMSNLAIKESLEDMLITLSKQYHMIRPLRARGTIFFYLVLDRQRANLAMARISLADVEKDLAF